MRLICPECKEPGLKVITRPPNMQIDNAETCGQVFTVVYCVCVQCGEKAKAEIFISSKKHAKQYAKRKVTHEELKND